MPGSLPPLQLVADPFVQQNFDALSRAWPSDPLYQITSGSPNGVVTGGPGALAVDLSTGTVYIHKAATVSNTGWETYQPASTPPVSYFYNRTAGDYTTASATYTTIDITNIHASLLCSGKPVHVALEGTWRNSSTTANYVGLFVDNVLVSGGERQTDIVSNALVLNAAWTLSSLSAGAHVFDLRWRTDAGTMTLKGGTTQGANFSVYELSV